MSRGSTAKAITAQREIDGETVLAHQAAVTRINIIHDVDSFTGREGP